jgi:hypothetical protein
VTGERQEFPGVEGLGTTGLKTLRGEQPDFAGKTPFARLRPYSVYGVNPRWQRRAEREGVGNVILASRPARWPGT